jgi:hypothetical protein
MSVGPANWVEGEALGASAVNSVETSVTQVGPPVLVRVSAIEIARGEVLAGRYQIEAVIGKGGSGIVLRAFDRVARVLVAVKILKPELATDPRWVERFSRELRLARQIQHPNVCRVFDIGQADGHWFITMELATSGTLRDQLGPKAATRPLEDRLADVRAVVEGLAAIHGAGIVHRDVKPDNFLRLGDGRLVLSDFGLATNPSDAPAVSIMVGTPHYMAPEVVMGEVATQRSDVWSAGVVVHEIMFGERPRWRRSSLEPPSSAGLPSTERALHEVCVAILAEEPEERPASAGALRQLVEDAIARPESQRRRRRVPSSKAIWGGVALLTAAAGGVLAPRLWQPVGASSARLAHHAAVTVVGSPIDLSAGSRVITRIDGRVHCAALLPQRETMRVVWGSPRRAEDIDLATGERAPSALQPETYQTGCPQLSPSGRQVLYTRVPNGGSPEIVRAEIDGSRAAVVTHGTDPLWLPGGEEFVFDVDASHVGVFSLPTMTANLLSAPAAHERQRVHSKSVNSAGNRVAVLYVDDTLSPKLDVYSIPDLGAVADWELPSSAGGLQFDNDDLLVADRGANGSVVHIDWTTGSARRTGYLPGRTLSSTVSLSSGEHVLVSRRIQKDVWLFDPGADARQLTRGGRMYSASWAPNGNVFAGRRLDDDRYVIELEHADGSSEQLTEGPSDCVPSAASDGVSWVYADYRARSIVHCSGRACAPITQEAAIPSWPRISPDGAQVAFVAESGMPHLYVIESSGKNRRDLGPAAYECPPVWASATSLWGFSGAGKERRWEEIDVVSGKKTGRSKPATSFNADTEACGLDAEPPGSPFYERARVVSQEDWELRRANPLTR